MRVPLSWLREYCDPEMSAEELADRLAMTGTEVERVSRLGPPDGEGFVVGRVASVEQHPDADRLRLCAVDTGDGERTIVCGAPNVAAGQAVAVALPGALLAGGERLEAATLRGVRSEGMILSEAELQIGVDSAGILVLEGAPPPGTALSEALPLAEPVLELEVTPNRVDCLGIFGVAREVHAVTGAALSAAPWSEDANAAGGAEVSELAAVTVEVPELCPRFTARAFTEVSIGPSPAWLRARLFAAGQRPINNLVDITNYVMLLTAQPLHAFDLDRVPEGALTIRRAADGEEMTTLDGVKRSFDAETVLVCDRDGPSGIAGIMGGQTSEVSESTRNVLLEVATWNGPNILRTSKTLALRSEASTRFEKQLHPELAMRAQRIASRLIVELCGARLAPGTIDVCAENPPPARLVLSSARTSGLLGMPISTDESGRYLEDLGFGVKAEDSQLAVTVPPDRHYDVTREADLIEEVARVHGLDEHLPATVPNAEQAGRLGREQELARRAEDVMRDLGFDEIVGWSFTDPEETARLRFAAEDPRANPLRMQNPLSVEHSVMRTTLLGSLLDAARYNASRDAARIALFESGRVYLREGPDDADGALAGRFSGKRPAPAHEPQLLACLCVGPLLPPRWRGEEAPADLFAMKGVLEALAEQLRVPIAVRASVMPFLHPGRSGEVLIAGRGAGWIGELHPLVAGEWGIDAGCAFEIELGALTAAAASGHEQYEDVTTYPAVYQDLAVVVPEDVPAAEVREAVLSGGGELLRSAEVFDLYHGEQLGAARKSLALRLAFRASDRTLTEAEVTAVRDRIRAEIGRIGGSLRE